MSEGPVRTYRLFERTVGRHGREPVLRGCASLAAALAQENVGRVPPEGLPNYVTPFALAAVARAAVVAGRDTGAGQRLLRDDVVRLCGDFSEMGTPTWAPARTPRCAA